MRSTMSLIVFVLAHPAVGLAADWVPDSVHFPADAGFADVKAFGAKGDGVTDDTAALQAAFAGKVHALYFPPGVYLVSDSIVTSTSKRYFIQGAGPAKSVIRLKDSAAGFGDPANPKAVLANEKTRINTGANGQAFRNSYHDLAIEVGAGNPGAIGLMYFNNNQGTIHNVTIRSLNPEKRGKAGLALIQNWPGPALVRYLKIEGFDYGIWSTIGQYSFVFEHLHLREQRVAGIHNAKQKLAIRGFKSENRVPAIQDASGFTVLIDAEFTGGAAEAAVVSQGQLFVRNLRTQGYPQAIESTAAKVAGPAVEEFASGEVATLFDGPKKSLNLPVEEAPAFTSSNPEDWANVTKFGAVPGGGDATAAVQKAIDSGKPIVYFPHGSYGIEGTVHVRGAVRRIDCLESQIDSGGGAGPLWRIADGDSPFVIIERYEGTYQSKRLSFEHASQRTLVLRTMIPRGEFYANTVKGGKLFLDDVCAGTMKFDGQTVFARQANPENQGTKVQNDGGTFWCLGLKTEKAGTILATTGGGRTEVLGGYFYYNRGKPGGAAPLVNVDSSVSVIATLTGAGGTLIQETRADVVKTLGKWPHLYVGQK
ncbi:MAG: hypothetical protein JNM56_31620 [Planctomycetia bacterium]|nr:hypothetical protein [Planctomycetia bacterium]